MLVSSSKSNIFYVDVMCYVLPNDLYSKVDIDLMYTTVYCVRGSLCLAEPLPRRLSHSHRKRGPTIKVQHQAPRPLSPVAARLRAQERERAEGKGRRRLSRNNFNSQVRRRSSHSFRVSDMCIYVHLSLLVVINNTH